MKKVFLLFMVVVLFICSCNKKTKKEITNGKNTFEKKYASNNITSIDFTKSEIIGESHYGFRYNFDIRINNSNNLDILDFCKTNFLSILNGRVTDNNVIQGIMTELNGGEYDIDKNPIGLRLQGVATEFFDAIEVEIFLKENDLLILDLKLYSPL